MNEKLWMWGPATCTHLVFLKLKGVLGDQCKVNEDKRGMSWGWGGTGRDRWFWGTPEYERMCVCWHEQPGSAFDHSYPNPWAWAQPGRGRFSSQHLAGWMLFSGYGVDIICTQGLLPLLFTAFHSFWGDGDEVKKLSSEISVIHSESQTCTEKSVLPRIQGSIRVPSLPHGQKEWP